MRRAGDPLWTTRLEIRPWRPDELERFYDLYRRAEVTRWFAHSPVQNLSEAAERMQRTIAQLEADPRFGSWAIVERASGTPAGTVLLKALPDGVGEIEIGWHLHPDSWGRGYATEAAAAVLARGFAGGLVEVWALTDPANHPSIAVCERLGMRSLGITQRWYHEPNMMFWVGAREDQQPSLRPGEPPL